MNSDEQFYGFRIDDFDKSSSIRSFRPTVPNKKGKNMNMNMDITVEQQRIGYLQGRIRDVSYTKTDELTKTFALLDDPTPTNGQELVERILAGKYVIPSNEKKRYGYAQDQITWRDPAKKADREGYDKAFNALEDARTAANDIIMIGSPADGLAALQAFEKWVYTPTTATVQ